MNDVQKLTVRAKPGINGNSADDFEGHARAIFDSVADLEAVLRSAMEVFHGRNYQHLPGAEAMSARNQDVAKMHHVFKWLEEVKGLALAINGASGK